MKDTLLLIPAYNEEGAIGALLEKLLEAKVMDFADVLVIDDASNDNTVQIVRNYPVDIISQVINQGYGAALQLGYKYAQRKNYHYVIQMDADGQHDVCNVGRIHEALLTPDEEGKLPDIVIGSRFMDGSQTFYISKLKMVAIQFFRFIIRKITHTQVLDPTSGLQGLSHRIFSYYASFMKFDTKYPDANVLIQMLILGGRVKEIPSVMHQRETGVSMHSGILKPLLYMMTMPLSILSVYLRLYGKDHLKFDKAVLEEV